MRKVISLTTLAICAWWGFHELGPVGIFYGWLGWGMVCFVGFAVKDMALDLLFFFRPQPRNINLTVTNDNTIKGHPDIEGRISGDPTRPSDEDFAGLITTRIKGGRW